MVLVSHRYKFIYIKNRKVAGSSVESFFGKYCVAPTDDYKYDDATPQKISKYGIVGSRLNMNNKSAWKNHKTAQNIKQDVPPKIFNTYHKFCVVRNPYDKMVSKYFHRISRQHINISFKEFCKREDTNNLYIHCINNKSVADTIIRYENLNEDIVKLCEKLNIKDYDISLLPNHKNNFRKDKKHYSTYYDEETKRIIYEKHKKEFEMFGYTFEEAPST